MRKQLFLVAIAVVVSFLFLSGLAMAAPKGTVHLNWGQYLNSGDTACPSGKPLINVTRKVINSLDSGTGLSDNDNLWWATSEYNQHIKVVETEDGFCATVTYKGKFESVGGDGPGCATDLNCGTEEGRLAAKVTGTFQGGYTRYLTGEFNPMLPTRGNLGTVDPNCDAVTGNCDFSGSWDWIDDYFDDGSWGELPWWGYVYHAGKNGTWVNADDPPGNQGNITGD
jgi:hypothetical protein